MAEWNKTTIGELCDSISNTYHAKDAEVVLVNTSDVLDGKVLSHNYTPNRNLKGQFKKTFIKDDILYSEIRPANRRFAFIDFDDTGRYIASTKLMVIRARKDKIRPKFLFAILKSNEIVLQLQHLAETRSGTFPQITFSSELAPMEINLPDLETQDRIVTILDAVDGKLNANSVINNNLQAQAFALFDKLFPKISNGDKTVGDYIVPKRGKNLLSKDAVAGNVPVVAGGLEAATYHNVANTAAPVLTISASGANAGFVNLWHTPVWSSDSSFIDLAMTDNVLFWYVLLKKRQKEIFDAQTGSAQPHIYPQHIATLKLCDLVETDIERFTKHATPLFDMIGANKAENDRLSALRDTLLPKLMSGEIDVSDVEI